MLWLLILHIAALLVWCAALIYLPVLVLAFPGQMVSTETAPSLPSIVRFIFTHYATPFALLAIIAGTLLFIMNGTTAPWLMVKLSAVAGMVMCHALLGLLILRAGSIDRTPTPDGGVAGVPDAIRLACYLLVTAVSCLIVTVLWLVLAKPTLGWF